MDIQRLRNLTTGRLHTDIGHIYEDLEIITGVSGLMTNMLPRVMRACKPWLREHVQDQRFWDGAYDTGHTGEVDLPMPSDAERDAMLALYAAQPDQRAIESEYQLMLDRPLRCWIDEAPMMRLTDACCDMLPLGAEARRHVARIDLEAIIRAIAEARALAFAEQSRTDHATGNYR